MNKEKKLLKNTAIYLAGNITSKILGFLMLPIYTHYLSQSELGSFDIIFSTASIFIPIITICTINSIFRFLLGVNDEKEVNTILTNGITIIILGILFSFIPFLIYINIFNSKNALLILFFIIATILNNTWQQIARALNYNITYAVSGVLFSIILMVSSVLLILFFHMGIEALLISYSVSPLIAFIYIECKVNTFKRIKYFYIDINVIRKMLKYSLPLLPTDINWWVMSTVNKYIILFFLGVDSNGILTVASKFPSLMSMLNNLFNTAWTESAIIEYESIDKDKFYTNIFNKYLRIQFTILLLLLPVIKYIMLFIVDSSFYSAWIYVPYLLLGTVFASFANFYGTGYLSSKDTKGTFSTTIIATVVNIFLNLVLIKVLGLLSATIANCVSYFILWIIRIYHLRKYFKIHLEKKIVLICFFLTIVFIIGYYQNILWIDITSIIIASLFGYFINKELISKGIYEFKNHFKRFRKK